MGALLACLVAVAAGCGSGDTEQTGSFPARHSPPADARYGGELRVIASGDVDFLDPGSTTYQFTYMIDFASQRALMGWLPEGGRAPVPDLAARQPVVSDGGRRLEFGIRRGVRFSPPVNRQVRAGDFEYAIERGLMPGVANSYMGSYLRHLIGYPEAVREAAADPGVAPDIPGVSAPSRHELVLRFTRPVATTAMQVLSLPLGAPVPEEYARPFDRQTPSAYGQHVVATGPYMVENDEEGDVTGFDPGKEIRLVRNPSWDPASDFRPAFVDRITVAEGFTDITSASRRILSGRSEVNGDFGPDATALQEAVEEHPEQLMIGPGGAVLYVALNTTIPPLDDPDVRRAIVAATDRKAMQLARGGPLTGPVASHFIPPGMPGFGLAGGYRGPDEPFLAHPSGDEETAAEYMRAAGYPTGRYDGDATLDLVAETTSTGRGTTAVILDAFEAVGIPVDTTFVSRDVMYTRFCNRPAAEVAICPSVGWLKEFNDPQTMLDAPFSGDRIQSVNNPNLSQLDHPAVNRAIERARDLVDPDERARAWAAIDRRVSSLAAAVPWQWASSASIFSENVAAVVNAFNSTADLSFTSLTDADRDSIGCEQAPLSPGC